MASPYRRTPSFDIRFSLNPLAHYSKLPTMADDLEASKTPGFKVGDKKTLDEYQKLGESLTEAALHLIDCHWLGSDSDNGLSLFLGSVSLRQIE